MNFHKINSINQKKKYHIKKDNIFIANENAINDKFSFVNKELKELLNNKIEVQTFLIDNKEFL